MRVIGLVLLLGLYGATTAAAGTAKPKSFALELRVTPRFAFSPARLLFVGELKGGEDSEELYCPQLEWDFGEDGGKSVEESDCPAYEAGMKVERHYSHSHDFPRAGIYNVTLTLSKAGRMLRRQTLQVTVRPGAGDPTNSTTP
jgi:hypothetical protein